MENFVLLQPNPITIPNLITSYGKWALIDEIFSAVRSLWPDYGLSFELHALTLAAHSCALLNIWYIKTHMVYTRDTSVPSIPLPTPLPNNPASPSADFREKQHAPVHHIQPDAGDRGWVKQQGHRQPVQNLIGLLEHLSAKVTVFSGPPCPLQEGKGKGESCSHSNLG